MSALKVEGKIVGVLKRTKTNKKTQEVFEIATYYITNGEGKPVELTSWDLDRKVGDNVSCPVYVRHWTYNGRSGYQVVEQRQE